MSTLLLVRHGLTALTGSILLAAMDPTGRSLGEAALGLAGFGLWRIQRLS